MINVSEAWKAKHLETLLPETFLEITCGFSDLGAADAASPVGAMESVLSNTDSIVNSEGASEQYATLEHNLWVLDGSRTVLPDSGPYSTTGYVSETDAGASVTINFAEPRETAIPGLVIVWSRDYNDYPTEFSVVAKNGDAEVASTTVTGNKTFESLVELELVGYDSITITPLKWRVPDRRCRLDSVDFGLHRTFTKESILSYTHEQMGSLNSAELPKNSISFSMDNVDGRWNPSNPTGAGKYLSERQTVTVRYGMDVDGVTEWVDAGTFYLSEWRAPANGLEANFTARDIFEFMLSEPYTGPKSGTLYELVSAALAIPDLPNTFVANVDESLKEYTGVLENDISVAEVIQMCANAGKCAIWQDRSGVLNIAPLKNKQTDYQIRKDVSYSHPEVELSKPLKAVSVAYGDNEQFVLSVNASGETQTLSNPLVESKEQAELLAKWVRDTLESRKTITGDFRADPTLDVYDIVNVDSKYGSLDSVVITNITYSYTGAFRATYSGRVTYAWTPFELGKTALGRGVLGWLS